MRACAETEPAAPGARAGRWLWGATGLALVALAVFAASWDLAAHPGPVLCAFRRATGLACPACGLTRAAALAARGQFAAAFSAHPLFALLAVEAAGAWLLWGERVFTGRRRGERWAAPLLLATAALLLAVWLARLGAGRLPG